MELAATSPGCPSRVIQRSPKYVVKASFSDLLPAAGTAGNTPAGHDSASTYGMATKESLSMERSEPSKSNAFTLGAAIDAFKKEASMTPVQRARRDVLKSMKITEDDLKAMGSDQREVFEKRIAKEIIFLLGKRGQTVPKDLEVAASKVLDHAT